MCLDSGWILMEMDETSNFNSSFGNKQTLKWPSSWHHELVWCSTTKDSSSSPVCINHHSSFKYFSFHLNINSKIYHLLLHVTVVLQIRRWGVTVAGGCGEAASAGGCSFLFPARVGALGVMERWWWCWREGWGEMKPDWLGQLPLWRLRSNEAHCSVCFYLCRLLFVFESISLLLLSICSSFSLCLLVSIFFFSLFVSSLRPLF